MRRLVLRLSQANQTLYDQALGRRSVGGGKSKKGFGIIQVTGQTDTAATKANDTLTVVAGTNINLSTNSGTNLELSANTSSITGAGIGVNLMLARGNFMS